MQMDSELELIGGAQRGDERAFEALFQRHRRWVYSLCLRMTRNSAEAEDLTQDAFLQLFRRISTFRGESSFSTWFHRLVINVVLMYLRKKQVDAVSLDTSPRGTPQSVRPECGTDDSILRETIDRINIDRALRRLPEDYRAAVVLHDVEGYKHEEIARARKSSVGTSKSQVHRARLMLRGLLSDHRQTPVKAAQFSRI